MEPDDIPVHDLLGVGGEAQPGPNDLRAIVARAGRRRLRMASVGMAVALAAGGGIGYAVSNHSTPAAQTATASGTGSPSSPAAGTPNGGSYSSSSSGGSAAIAQPIGSPLHFTKVFTRTAGGVTIRAYLWNFPRGGVAMPAGCGFGSPQLQAELSTAKMVGTVSGFGPGLVQSQVVGGAEGDPTGVVTMATTSKVTEVSMSFAGGGTDRMAPVNGWVVLAAPVSTGLDYGKPLGTLTERGSNGAVVKSQAVTLGIQAGIPTGVPCGVLCPKIRSVQTVPANSNTASGAVAAPTVDCAPGPPCTTLPMTPSGPPVKGGPVTGALSGGASSGGASSGVASSTVSGGYACPLIYPPAPSGGATGSGASTGSGTVTGTASSTP
jgi:hypothetical protein